MMEPTKRTLDQIESQAKKHRVKLGKGCILSMNNLTNSVAVSVTASWAQLLRIRRYDRCESQRRDEWTRHLDSKYGCVPGLTDAMFALTWDLCRNLDQTPIMSSTTCKMQDLALRAISINGIIHQCRASTITSSAISTEKASLYRDNKYTMLRRYVEKIMIDDVKRCREPNDVGVLSVSLQQVHQSLCYMRDGRIDRALESVLAHWTFADCLRIMEIGMHVFFEQRLGHQHGDNAMQVSMAKLAGERIHERYMESEFDHIGEMNMVLSTPCSQTLLYTQETFSRNYL
ncbi:MAG: hypothetical protein BYD32DRAFT_408151 [Podila humilis]|nr:MAG: hypothetical protein BYD32DRAFT_408151 [Podila humilis]